MLGETAFRVVVISPIRVPISRTPPGGMILTDSPSDSDNAANRIRRQTSEQNDYVPTGQTLQAAHISDAQPSR